jgi:SnoaL-like domain
MPIERSDVETWVAAYERAWRTAGTELLGGLFTEDATYRMSPYKGPAQGLDAIAKLWERERVGPGEQFSMRHAVIAVEQETAVARVEVAYGDGSEYRDLWVLHFAPDGRCREFEEWPFWPGQPISPPTLPSP